MALAYPDDDGSTGFRVLVVDPFPLVRSTISTLLLENRLANRVHFAENGNEAMRQHLKYRPEIVITDVDLMTKREGIRLVRKVKQGPTPTLVLILSSCNAPETLADCIASGADSYVHRTADPELLVTAIHKMATAQPIWFLGNNTESMQPDQPDHISETVANLTPRERDILALMLMRFSNNEIASRLHLARQTVKNYASSVLQKLEFTNRAELFSSPFGAKYIEVAGRLIAASPATSYSRLTAV